MSKEPFEAEFNAKEVTKFLNESAKKLSDLRPLMREAAQGLKFVVDQNFETEGTFTGDKWQAWSDKYKKWRLKKKKGQGGILSFEGNLKRDIRSGYDNTTAFVASGKDYAAIHNFGFKGIVTKERENKRKGTKTRFSCNMNTPKREFMRINETEQQNLIEDLQEFLEQELRKLK